MPSYIVHHNTGTIIPADECLLIQYNKEDHDDSEEEILELSGQKIIDLENIGQNEAWAIWHTLKNRLGWAGTYFQYGDIVLHLADEDGEIIESISDDSLTQAMKDAIDDSYVWAKGIEERLTEIGNEMKPSITVYPDGSFVVDDDAETKGYLKDGTKVRLEDLPFWS